MAVLPDGGVYVTRRAPQNDVLLLKDADGDGTVDAPITVARIPDVHGITIKDGKIYLAAVRELYVGDIAKDGSLENIKPIYEDLPDAGQHPNRTLAFSPMVSFTSLSEALATPHPRQIPKARPCSR